MPRNRNGHFGKAAPATNGPTVFKCPADTVGRIISEGSSYEWNWELNGHRMDETTTGNLKMVVVTIGPEGHFETNASTTGGITSPLPTSANADSGQFAARHRDRSLGARVGRRTAF